MKSTLTFRTTQRCDGARLWECVREAGVLELNSAYFYLAFADFFGSSCLIAEEDGNCVGCTLAFRLPERQEALFVWQIGVLPSMRRQGLGKRMIRELLNAESCRDIQYLLATVSPENEASFRLFRGLAEALNASYCYSDYFTPCMFPNPHEEEKMFSIGPFPARK